MRKVDKFKYKRYAVQTAFLVFMIYAGIILKANLHALCPFGGFAALMSLISDNFLVKRIAISSFILALSIFIMTAVTGRSFCSWICPLGTIQEWVGNLGRKMFGRRFEISQNIDIPLRYLKYLVLFTIIYFTWVTGELVFRAYDPWPALMHISSEELFQDFFYGFIFLILFVFIGSFFFERFWCKYFCPLGALTAVLSKIGFVKIYKTDCCIECSKCKKFCPVNLDPVKKDSVSSAECLNCMKCVDVCPIGGGVELRSRLSKKKVVSSTVYMLVVLLIFFGIYGAAKYAGCWETTHGQSKKILQIESKGGKGNGYRGGK
jgi:polyferredoxin